MCRYMYMCRYEYMYMYTNVSNWIESAEVQKAMRVCVFGLCSERYNLLPRLRLLWGFSAPLLALLSAWRQTHMYPRMFAIEALPSLCRANSSSPEYF